jgi:hypothetical protein
MIIHTLVYDNISPAIIRAHEAVCQHFGLPVEYTRDNIAHGTWLAATVRGGAEDVIGFLDIDCVPTNRAIIDVAIDYARQQRTFIGIAQASNHFAPPANSHIFAAPAFFFIHREAWREMGCPAFDELAGSDTAQNVSRRAEELGKRYCCLYPTHWEKPSHEGVWRLGNYGVYGIGTHFHGGVYHLYQSRFNSHIELFTQRCNEICAGTFTTTGMRSAFTDL